MNTSFTNDKNECPTESCNLTFREVEKNPERQFIADLFDYKWCSERHKRNGHQVFLGALLMLLFITVYTVFSGNLFESFFLFVLVSYWYSGVSTPLGSNFLFHSLFYCPGDHRKLFLKTCASMPIRPDSVLRSVFLFGLVMGLVVILAGSLVNILVLSVSSAMGLKMLSLDFISLKFAIACLLFPLLIASMYASLATGDRLLGVFCLVGAITIWPISRSINNLSRVNWLTRWGVVASFFTLALVLVGIVIFKHLRSDSGRRL